MDNRARAESGCVGALPAQHFWGQFTNFSVTCLPARTSDTHWRSHKMAQRRSTAGATTQPRSERRVESGALSTL